MKQSSSLHMLLSIVVLLAALGQSPACASVLSHRRAPKTWQNVEHVLISRLGRRESVARPLTEFEIFRSYTFPSVLAQTHASFEWIVYVYRTVPSSVKLALVALLAEYERFHVAEADQHACFSRRLQPPEFWPVVDQLELFDLRLAWDSVSLVVTTRLAATDALPRDAMARRALRRT